MDNAVIISNYCANKLLTNNVFDKYMISKPCFIFNLLPCELLTDNQKKYFERINILILYQKIRNTNFTREASNIFRNNDNIIGLKGIFIQNLYYEKNYIRIFGDLDILATSEKSYNEYNKLRNMGYELVKSNHFFDNNHLAICLLRKRYFSKACHIELSKKNCNEDRVILELHGNLNRCNSGNVSFNINEMFNRSQNRRVDNYTIRMLSPEDNLSYLMFHSIKHLSYTSFIKKQNKSMNLQSFYDVAQIIENESIDWTLFYKLVCEYSILPFVSLFLKMFTDIFCNIIPEEIHEKIFAESSNLDFSWKRIYNNVMAMSPEKIIIGDLSEFPQLESVFNSACKNTSPDKVWSTYVADYNINII